ncbi:hypothetical protein RKLH11_996 [Rhodobacteraceae bacterium KLH11]|nr:hypothetical protein RKLH11_996 [Rhodobacteraceae bacterium KLH11]
MALDMPPVQAFFLVSLGGVTQFLILWLGLTAVSWAMIRGMGARLSLLRLGALVSNAALPLWIGAPALAFWLSGPAGLGPLTMLIALASLGLFATVMARLLSAELNWNLSRAAVAVSATLAFLASSIFLSL